MGKVRFAVLAVLVMLLFAFGFPAAAYAASDDLPALSFENGVEKVYAGVPFEVPVKLSPAADRDISFSVTGSDGSSFSGVVKAGEKTGTIKLDAPPEHDGRVSYTLDSSAAYSIGKKDSVLLMGYKVPEFRLSYQGLKYIKINETIELEIAKDSDDYVVQDTLFTVRAGSENGQVIAQATVERWGKRTTLRITNNGELDRRVDLYVCVDATGKVIGKLDAIMGTVNDEGMRTVNTDKNQIAISFDCAYNDTHVDYILDLLDEYNIKTTFFVTGFWVDKFPHTLKKIYERGHEIGNHTLNHPRLTELSDKSIYKELNTVSDKVEEIIGVRPNLFRPPYGIYSPRVVGIADVLGCDTILWAHDSMDWKPKPREEVIIKKSTEKTVAGDIILFHAGAELTEKTLPVVLERLTKDKGLEIVRISALVYDGDVSVTPEGLVTAGSDYASYTGSDLFAGVYTPDVADASLSLRFGDDTWFLHEDEAAAIKAGLTGVEVSQNLTADVSAAAEGDVVGTVVFSRYTHPDMTAELVVGAQAGNAAVTPAVSAGDAPDAEASPDTDSNDEQTPEDKSGEDSCASLANVLTFVSVLGMVAVVVVLVLKKRSEK